MEWVVELGNQIWTWFGVEDNRDRASAIAAVAAVIVTVLGAMLGMFWYVSKRAVKTVLPTKSIEPSLEKHALPSEAKKLTTLEFIAIRREMKADLEQDLAEAHEDEKAELQARITELESQIADPEPALIDAQKTIAELTARLERMGNDIGGDRLAEAQAALAKLDFSVADDIFAEVEVRHQMEIQQAARAAFGRGEVAEAEIRWHDAAEHYGRAARLKPDCETLYKATQFTFYSGHYPKMFRLAEEYLELAKEEGDDAEISSALDRNATALQYLGQLPEAETVFREALAIGEKTIGTAHPNYAIDLNNLAGVVQAQGRYDEAETLFSQAIQIALDSLGADHPNIKTFQTNLDKLLAQKP